MHLVRVNNPDNIRSPKLSLIIITELVNDFYKRAWWACSLSDRYALWLQRKRRIVLRTLARKIKDRVSCLQLRSFGFAALMSSFIDLAKNIELTIQQGLNRCLDLLMADYIEGLDLLCKLGLRGAELMSLLIGGLRSAFCVLSFY